MKMKQLHMQVMILFVFLKLFFVLQCDRIVYMYYYDKTNINRNCRFNFLQKCYPYFDLAGETHRLWSSGRTPFPIGVGRNGKRVDSINLLTEFSALAQAAPEGINTCIITLICIKLITTKYIIENCVLSLKNCILFIFIHVYGNHYMYWLKFLVCIYSPFLLIL